MFRPNLAVLPDQQRRLWPALADVPDSFVLYGGTALALRLGHRSSVDVDFFSSSPLDHDALFAIPFVTRAEVLQREPGVLTLSVPMDGGPVKVSFFGGIGFGRVGRPDRTEDGVLRIASLLDLFGTKLKVLLQRVAARDYLDLAAILRAGVPLPDGLGAARALFGNEFPPIEAVKALAYFDEGEAVNVDSETRGYLARQAAAWDCTVSRIDKAAESVADTPGAV